MIAALIAVAATTLATAAPDRLIRCTLGRVTNLEARTPAELGITGRHTLTVLQPAAATGGADLPNPGAAGAAQLRVYDPDRILPIEHLDDLADAWPKRVEMTARLSAGRSAFVSLGGIDPAVGAATGSAGIMIGGTSVDRDHFYQGDCRVEIGPGLAAKFDKESRP